jgi:hypothetical protein
VRRGYADSSEVSVSIAEHRDFVPGSVSGISVVFAAGSGN